MALLHESRVALDHGKVDQGWKLFHAARRMEIFGMEDKELPDVAKKLREEASKLKPWRQRAVNALLGNDDVPIPARRSLVLAATIRDEHYDNQGYKDQLIGAQFLFLVSVLAVIMGALLGMSYANLLPFGGVSLPPTFASIVAVMLFGKLGATFSAVLRASDSKASVRIPEITSANRVSFLRILIGGVSAVVVYLALNSELAGVFSFRDSLKTLTPFTIYVVAFASGITERVVLRAIESVLGKPVASNASTSQAEGGANA